MNTFCDVCLCNIYFFVAINISLLPTDYWLCHYIIMRILLKADSPFPFLIQITTPGLSFYKVFVGRYRLFAEDVGQGSRAEEEVEALIRQISTWVRSAAPYRRK